VSEVNEHPLMPSSYQSLAELSQQFASAGLRRTPWVVARHQADEAEAQAYSVALRKAVLDGSSRALGDAKVGDHLLALDERTRRSEPARGIQVGDPQSVQPADRDALRSLQPIAPSAPAQPVAPPAEGASAAADVRSASVWAIRTDRRDVGQLLAGETFGQPRKGETPGQTAEGTATPPVKPAVQ
jgi:hypothetical protein